jgi:hypothetical protein
VKDKKRTKEKSSVAQYTVQGDFGDVDVAYPECTLYVTSNVTLPSASAVQATIEQYTPNEGLPGLLLTVWNSGQKPKPQSRTIKLGPEQILTVDE